MSRNRFGPLPTFLLALCAAAPVPASAQAPAARGDQPVPTTAATPARPLRDSPVFGRPLTVLDYVLAGVQAQLTPTRDWYSWARRGRWLAGDGPTRPEEVKARVGYDPHTDSVGVGYEIVVPGLLATPRQVCEGMLLMYLEPALGLGRMYSGVRGMSSARLADYLPKGPGGALTDEQRETLAPDLHGRMLLWVSIVDMSRRTTWYCSRPASGTELTVTQR